MLNSCSILLVTIISVTVLVMEVATVFVYVMVHYVCLLLVG